MPHDKGNANDTLVNQLKELDRKLEVSRTQSSPQSTQSPDSAPHTAIEQPLEQPQPIAKPEVVTTPEHVASEAAFEKYKQVDDDHPEESPYVIKQAKPTKSDVQQALVKSQQLQDIEELMTKDLGEVYQRLSPADQQKFKAKGEAVAQEIEGLMQRAKLTAKKVLNLIREWLKLLPGINKFFLEQEAKIKAEELIHYARRHNNNNKI